MAGKGKSKAKTGKKKNYKKKYMKQKKIGDFTHLKNNMTLPRFLMIKQNFNLSGYVASGQASGYFDIGANTAHNPFDNSGNGWSSPDSFTDITNNGVLLTGSTLTLESQNFNELVSIYNSTRVLSSKLSVTCSPQALTDSVKLFITPYCSGIDGSQSSDNPANDMTQAFAPRCKNKIISANVASQKQNTLTVSCSVASLFGVKSRAVLDEDNYSGTVQNNYQLNNCATYRVFWSTLDEVVLATPLTFQFRLTQITKFQAPENSYIP